MRRSIGLRATPDRIWISVIEASEPTEFELLVSTSLPIPVALDPPDRLRFVGQAVVDTIAEYSVALAGIRLAEPIARSVDPSRLHIEGVLQELLASSSVGSYFYGPIATMARLLGEEDRRVIKQYIEGLPFGGISGWPALAPSQRESILVAVAAHSLEPS